ncbi:uncharacterized protein [Watersipora subatra]|uniref:uncharacterized protein n=1 Tax=Watersipora subatra TaxID=2589382 RepID=UPI00355C9D93
MSHVDIETGHGYEVAGQDLADDLLKAILQSFTLIQDRRLFTTFVYTSVLAFELNSPSANLPEYDSTRTSDTANTKLSENQESPDWPANIKRAPHLTVSDYFELDIHKCGTKFTNSGIYHAIKSGNLAQLQRCIKYGEDVSLRDEEFGSSYLMLVVNCADLHSEKLYLPMLHELALAGCDPNISDCTGLPPLGEAIQKNLEDMMVSLLQLGSEGSDAIKALIQNDTGPFQMQTLKWYQKHTPSLRQAVENEDIRTIKRLLSHWCRVNVKYNSVTPYKMACNLYGKQHIICDLLETHFHTLEFIHSALAGNRDRVLDMKSNHHCDYGWLNKGYQENVLQPLQPRSVYDAVKALGHKHLLDIVPQPFHRPKTQPADSSVTSKLCIIS